MLYETAQRVVAAEALPDVVTAALQGLRALVPRCTYGVAIADGQPRQLTVAATLGREASAIGWKPGGALPAAEDVTRDLHRGRTVRGGDGRHVAVPMMHHGVLLGALLLHAPTPLDAPHIALVHEVAQLASAGLRRHYLQQELVRAQDAARRATERKTSFLHHLSHELRTPLNAILGYLELIREEGDALSLPELRQDLVRVHRAADHLRALISEVLDLGKLEAGKLDLTLSTVDLVELVEDLEHLTRPLIATKGNRWTCDMPEEVWVLGDPLRLRQVLVNLVGNAAKFTQEGIISLGVTFEDRMCVIAVSDTGVGMSTEKLERLFEPFVQVHEDPSYGGTGLGLAIAKQFVELMGGTISVQSEAGRGSTFRVEMMRVIPD